MKYREIVEATFIRRLNRFVAEVELSGKSEQVHVKNTGRLKELLIPGARVYLEPSSNPKRKYKYSLVTVESNGRYFNIDSQVPNRIVFDAVLNGSIHELPPVNRLEREKTYGNSRFDLYYEEGERQGYIEVKGVTLALNGIAKFPDAPTIRGTKHIQELACAVQEGYDGILFFLLQMDGCQSFEPNEALDPPFAKALREAVQQGVKVLAYDSVVTSDSIRIGQPVQVHKVW